MTSSHACSVVVYSSLRIFVACFSCWHFTKKTGSIKKLLCRCHPYKRWWKYEEKQNKIVLSIFSKYFHAFFFFPFMSNKNHAKNVTNKQRTHQKQISVFISCSLFFIFFLLLAKLKCARNPMLFFLRYFLWNFFFRT